MTKEQLVDIYIKDLSEAKYGSQWEVLIPAAKAAIAQDIQTHNLSESVQEIWNAIITKDRADRLAYLQQGDPNATLPDLEPEIAASL